MADLEDVTSLIETSTLTLTTLSYEDPELLLFIVKVLLCIILVFGVVTNSSIVILMVVYGFRNVSDVFIGILCTANTVFLVVYVPLELSEQNMHTMSLFFCRFYNTIDHAGNKCAVHYDGRIFKIAYPI